MRCGVRAHVARRATVWARGAHLLLRSVVVDVATREAHSSASCHEHAGSIFCRVAEDAAAGDIHDGVALIAHLSLDQDATGDGKPDQADRAIFDADHPTVLAAAVEPHRRAFLVRLDGHVPHYDEHRRHVVRAWAQPNLAAVAIMLALIFKESCLSLSFQAICCFNVALIAVNCLHAAVRCF